jgi:hypothetical protein
MGKGFHRESGISPLIQAQSSFYAHYKVNNMPFPVTYYINIFSTVMLSKQQTNSVAFVRKQTMPTDRPPLVGEVSANFCG